MDPRLIRHYEDELQHLREMGAEFARHSPKIAARLRMDGVEVADPYVERLLEGFAFLAARVQLRLDAEFPRFTQRLLDIVYPNFLAPTPSMLVAQVQPDLGDAGLAAGVTIPRGSLLRGAPHRDTGTACRFRTAQDLTLWPLEITEAGYFTHASQLPLAAVPQWRGYGGGLRLKLRTTAGLSFSRLALQDLRLHFGGSGETPWRLHELVCGRCLGGIVRAAGNGAQAATFELLGGDDVRTVGFEATQAMLPSALPGLDGYRLLQEYFAFPQRFLFADLCGLGDALRAACPEVAEAEVILLFDRGEASLQQTVDADSLLLNCVPAVNLFEHRCDRIQVGAQRHDFHVVPDRTRPLDHEVHHLTEVVGHCVGDHVERRFLPFYAAWHHASHEHGTYYAVQREPRLLSSRQLRDGPRSSYIGSEVYLSIVDAAEAPYPESLEQLGVVAMCSNRDLPVLMDTRAGLALEGSAPVKAIRIVRGPSRPLPSLRESRLLWSFVSQLSLNHLSLLDSSADEGAAALREMLKLYVRDAEPAHQRQIDALRSVRTQPVVRRLPMPGPIAFGRGVRIDIEADEMAFQGGSLFLLGCVLEIFLARHVSMNGFTETHVHAQGRGEVLAGRPRCGARPVL